MPKVDDTIFNAWSANWGTPLEISGPVLDAVRNVIQICAASPRRPRIIFISSTCAIGHWPLMHPSSHCYLRSLPGIQRGLPKTGTARADASLSSCLRAPTSSTDFASLLSVQVLLGVRRQGLGRSAGRSKDRYTW